MCSAFPVLWNLTSQLMPFPDLLYVQYKGILWGLTKQILNISNPYYVYISMIHWLTFIILVFINYPDIFGILWSNTILWSAQDPNKFDSYSVNMFCGTVFLWKDLFSVYKHRIYIYIFLFFLYPVESFLQRWGNCFGLHQNSKFPITKIV